jgi:hypothetical protein
MMTILVFGFENSFLGWRKEGERMGEVLKLKGERSLEMDAF